MMKRYAAHCIYLAPEKIYRLHVIELNDAGQIQDIFPLTQEIESTVFYNGLIVPFKKNSVLPDDIRTILSLEKLQDLIATERGIPVGLYHFDTTNLQITNETKITLLSLTS